MARVEFSFMLENVQKLRLDSPFERSLEFCQFIAFVDFDSEQLWKNFWANLLTYVLFKQFIVAIAIETFNLLLSF